MKGQIPKTNAGFWLRTLAFATDYIVIGAYVAVLIGAGAVVNQSWPAFANSLFGTALSSQAIGFLLLTLPAILYFSLAEAGPSGATWGKRRLGIRVTVLDGGRLGFGRALGRTLLKFIPWELAHTCIWQFSQATDEPSWLLDVGLGVVWLLVGANIVCMLRSARGQTVYDRLAGTVVVRVDGAEAQAGAEAEVAGAEAAGAEVGDKRGPAA